MVLLPVFPRRSILTQLRVPSSLSSLRPQRKKDALLGGIGDPGNYCILELLESRMDGLYNHEAARLVQLADERLLIGNG